MTAKERLIVALDVDSLDQALPLVDQLAPFVGCFKVGLQLLTREGAPQVIRRLHERGGKIFLDGKFDDIPNTVGSAAKAAAALGVKYFDVHASCGPEAMRAAAAVKGDSKLLAVTVLTSLDDATTHRLFGAGIREKVLQFAREAKDAGADGIVCSPQELEWVGADPALASLQKVTPGVRPTWAEAGDQKRVLTPAEAIRRGATHLVVGRPLVKPPASVGSPVDAAKRILDEIASVEPGGAR